MDSQISVTYTKDYKQYCFYVWYQKGRPAITDLRLHIDKFQGKYRPAADTILGWMKEENWISQADEMDAYLHEEMKKKVLTERLRMLVKHADIGREVQDMAMVYLREEGITSQSAALRALDLGIGIEKESANISRLMQDVAQMDDIKLTKQLGNLLDKTKVKNNDE